MNHRDQIHDQWLVLRLPQPGATLESVRVDGRDIPFTPEPGEEDTYSILPGLPENALKNAVIEVLWSPPESEVDSGDGHLRYKLPLQGIIPITAYTANAVIDEGAPYRFGGELAPFGRYNMFWTKRPGGDYYATGMGTCGLSFERAPEAE